MSGWKFGGLPGIKGGCRDGFPASTVRRMLIGLRKGLVSSTSSDNGSLSAWRDDEGFVRVEMHRFRQTIAEGRFKTAKAAGEWWTKHLPLIEKGNRDAEAR